ncbi:MAG TPA: hypothetical protein VIH90_07575 [Candidatus Saccharimonadales bacterium]
MAIAVIERARTLEIPTVPNYLRQLVRFSRPIEERYKTVRERNLHLATSLAGQNFGFFSLIFETSEGLTHSLQHTDRKNKLMLNRVYCELGADFEEAYYDIPVLGDEASSRRVIPIQNGGLVIETMSKIDDWSSFSVKVWASRQALLNTCELPKV